MKLAEPEYEEITLELPTHEEIEKRAYELYLASNEDGHALEHWLIAEEELQQERANRRKSAPLKSMVAAVGSSS